MNDSNLARREPEVMLQPAVSNGPGVALTAMEMHALIPRMELARRMPRQPAVFAERLKTEVLFDPGPMVYRKPGKDENGKDIELIGPSVRMAEIAGRLFGNLDISEPTITEAEGQVTAVVRVMDLESNYCVPGVSSISLVTRSGRRMPPHVVSNLRLAAAAKALRNGIEKVVGKHTLLEMVRLCLDAQTKRAEATMKKTGGKETWWAGELKTWAKLGITEADLFAALGVGGLGEVTPKHSTRLTACMNSIKQEQVPPRVALGLESDEPQSASAPPTDDFPFDDDAL